MTFTKIKSTQKLNDVRRICSPEYEAVVGYNEQQIADLHNQRPNYTFRRHDQARISYAV
jgi:hypothetical protein